MRRLVPLTLIALLAVACGPGDAEATSMTTTNPPATTSTSPGTTTTLAVATTTVPEPTTTTLSVDRYQIVEGEFSGPDSFSVEVGETFEIEVVSDAPGELHVHGFDLLFELTAGEATLVAFPAAAPGIYEVELEGTHTHLFDVEVLG